MLRKIYINYAIALATQRHLYLESSFTTVKPTINGQNNKIKNYMEWFYR